MKLTKWFPVSVRPVHVGKYHYQGWLWDESYMHWNGNQWGYFRGKNWVHMAEVVTDQWRGLAHNPIKAKAGK